MNRIAFLTVYLSHYFCNYLSGVRDLLTLEDKQPIGPEPSVHFLDMNIYFSVKKNSSVCLKLFHFFQYNVMNSATNEVMQIGLSPEKRIYPA